MLLNHQGFVYHIHNSSTISGFDAYRGRVVKVVDGTYEVEALTGYLAGKNIAIREVNSQWQGPLPKVDDLMWWIDGTEKDGRRLCDCVKQPEIIPESLVEVYE